MNFDTKKAVFWLKKQLKNDKWQFRKRAKSPEQKGFLLIKIGIYKQILAKISKVYKNGQRKTLNS